MIFSTRLFATVAGMVRSCCENFQVGATEIKGGKDVRADYSNFGSCVNVWAPGTRIESTWVGSSSKVNFLSGTSMAAPHFAGELILRTVRDTVNRPAI